MTFVGQFIDHDPTFDPTSRLGVATEPRTSPNGRTARFDLDSVYGAGPVMQPERYDGADSAPLWFYVPVRPPDQGRRRSRRLDRKPIPHAPCMAASTTGSQARALGDRSRPTTADPTITAAA